MESGLDIDIVSGRPISHADSKRHKEEKRREHVISRYHSLVSDLAGSGGETVWQIAELYENRINELIREDATCLAYQAIFDTIGVKINIGKAIATSKINEIENMK